VSHLSTSIDCRPSACAEAADHRRHFSARRNPNTRPTSCESVSYRSDRFARTQPEGYEWEAVQEMFLASRSRFVGMAHSILRNQEDAEDAVQDAILSAHRHLRSFEGRSALTTWFTRIVLNAALMILRKRKPSRMGPIPESCTTDEIPWAERIPDPQPDPEKVCAEEETLQWIDVWLGKMSPMLRQAFTMTYYEEMSTEEAGAMLGVTPGTFKSRLFRAKRLLMKQARRSLVAPIRKAAHSPFLARQNDFRTLAAKPVQVSSPEIAPL
jgi:RNA polymerase sigma-70 factor (ECF subfamily)